MGAAVVTWSKKVAPDDTISISSFECTGPRIWSLFANTMLPSVLVK
jgi:hypothetical protein